MAKTVYVLMYDDDLLLKRRDTWKLIGNIRRTLDCLSLPNCIVERMKKERKYYEVVLREIEAELTRRGDDLSPLEEE